MDAGTHDEIFAAIGAHGQWKARLRMAIAQGSSEMTAETAARDDACAFGEWLYKGASAEAKASPYYASCRTLHAQFHEAAGAVLALALAGKKAEADAKLAIDSDFDRTSVALTREMMVWFNSSA